MSAVKEVHNSISSTLHPATYTLQMSIFDKVPRQEFKGGSHAGTILLGSLPKHCGTIEDSQNIMEGRLLMFLYNLLAMYALEIQGSSSRWHLQRIVQRDALSLEQLDTGWKKFDLNSIRMNPVNIYVIDSGIRITHDEFTGNRAVYGTNIINPQNVPEDCAGHGTHVAGLAAGARSGVASQAKLISVKVLDCFGKGLCSDILTALEWVVQDSALRREMGERSVAVMSVGSSDVKCAATSSATQLLWNTGVVIAAAAGNSRTDACLLYPANNPSTVTVGATDIEDRIFVNNNVGSCVDIFAPGVRLLSAWGSSSDTEVKLSSGTSMATPIVAGIAALILGADPSLSADEVRDILLLSSTRNKILKPFTNSTMTAAVNKMALAPWSRLFDEVLMNSESDSGSSRGRTHPDIPQRDTNWNSSATIVAIHMKLIPKTIPAMYYVVVKISKALAYTASLPYESILPRREYGTTKLSNGSEPSIVRLVFYIPLDPLLLSIYTRRWIEADADGLLSRRISESFMFPEGTLASGLLINITVPDAAIESDEGGKFEDRHNDELGSVEIVLIVLAILTAILVVVAVLVEIVMVKAVMRCCRPEILTTHSGEGIAIAPKGDLAALAEAI